MMIGEAITSLQAPGFLHSRDKLALFSARIFVSGSPLFHCLSLGLLNEFRKFKFRNNSSVLFSDGDFLNFVFKAQAIVHVVVLFRDARTEC